MILVAPTSFKGTLSAAQTANAMAAGARRAAPALEVTALPLSDGGPGLLDAVRGPLRGVLRSADVPGPMGGAVRARYLLVPGGVVVETAEACGLHLLPPSGLDPLRATTLGVGKLVRAALADAGARQPAMPPRLVLGLGGSGTVDGGLGMAVALGFTALDAGGRPVPPGGGGLEGLATLLPPPGRVAPGPVLALADVTAPLMGERGAARVFAPQKGADAAAVERLEAGLGRLAARLQADLGRDVADLPGAGAAGGLGAGCVAFLGAELVPGAPWVLDGVGFDAHLARAALVVTGEGAVDAQTGLGKVVGEVLARAGRTGVPVLVLAGSVAAELPPGSWGADAGGARLDAAGLADLAAREVGAWLSGDRGAGALRLRG